MQGIRRNIDWDSEGGLVLWTVFFGLLESWGGEEQGWFVWCLREVMGKMGVRSWEQVLERVRGFFWVEGVFEERVGLVRGVVEG